MCRLLTKDSCFHFYYDGVNEKGEPTQITKHFDFKLDGRVDGTDDGGYHRTSSDRQTRICLRLLS